MNTAIDELMMRSPEPTSVVEAAHVPVSVLLQELLDDAPVDQFTLDWLIGSLPERSFGILMLILGVVAMVPVGSMIPGLMLAVLAVQMTVGRTGPVFPRRVALHPLPTRQLVRMGRYPIRALTYLERFIRPRWPALFLGSRQSIGVVVLLLTFIVMLAPVPLSNVPPAAAIALISLASIEEDGALLAVGLVFALVLLGLAFAAIWGAVATTALLG
ncbi:MAG TPA: exopolysaccharide biosynthesis protein [Xanthobacteraceae bacterium]|jgi:hypothetical protein|nr:exopolysaccharide biosynthesis protein [Xanthobacteraceae bacterium]